MLYNLKMGTCGTKENYVHNPNLVQNENLDPVPLIYIKKFNLTESNEKLTSNTELPNSNKTNSNKLLIIETTITCSEVQNKANDKTNDKVLNQAYSNTTSKNVTQNKHSKLKEYEEKSFVNSALKKSNSKRKILQF